MSLIGFALCCLGLLSTKAGAGSAQKGAWAVLSAPDDHAMHQCQLTLNEISKVFLDLSWTLGAPRYEPSRRSSFLRVTRHPSLNRTSASGTMAAASKRVPRKIQGADGICPSCKGEGHIFRPKSLAENTDAGPLDNLPAVADGTFPKTGVYAIDEYGFSVQGLRPFFWAVPNHYMWKTTLAARAQVWTQDKLDRWASLITPGSFVIDIGANVGDSTLPMAIHAARTVAFEAHPGAAMVLQAQAIANPDLKIDVHPVAVADSSGTMSLNVDCDGCNAGPVETSEWHGQAVIQVPKVEMGTFLVDKYGKDFLRQVSFVKIDTEGYDKTLLRVYKQLLGIHRPKFWVEWFGPYRNSHVGGEHISPGSRDLFAAIDEIGYVAVHPQSGAKLTPADKDGIPDLLLLPK